jgi:precorrin-2 dehydrogenase/sirohydrochlorin ferrochelatase
LKELAEKGRIEWQNREWREKDLEDAWLVVAATGDADINLQIRELAEICRLWVNAVDDPENCSVAFPSFLSRGDLIIAISTSGKSPALSRKIRESMEASWNEATGEALDWISGFRDKVKAEIQTAKQRFDFWDQALSPGVVDMIRLGKIDEMKDAIQKAFKEFKSNA